MKLIRGALAEAADEDDHLDSAYAPDFLADGGRIELPGDLAPLAVRALDRITGDDSEWGELWEESDSYADATAALATMRAALTS